MPSSLLSRRQKVKIHKKINVLYIFPKNYQIIQLRITLHRRRRPFQRVYFCSCRAILQQKNFFFALNIIIIVIPFLCIVLAHATRNVHRLLILYGAVEREREKESQL